MIQRIQSIFLLLAAVLLVLIPFLPVATMPTLAADNNVMITDLGPMQFVALAGAIIAFFTIFFFRNRSLQLRISQLALLVNFALLIWEAIEFYGFNQAVDTKVSLSWGAFLPFLALIFISLAIGGIRKDEKIVRSMDRLR